MTRLKGVLQIICEQSQKYLSTNFVDNMNPPIFVY
jgi:hypothetical protein